jgi:hypothetical protein
MQKRSKNSPYGTRGTLLGTAIIKDSCFTCFATRIRTISLTRYKRQLAFLFACFCCIGVYSQPSIFRNPADGILTGNGASSITPWSIFTNPAGTAMVESPLVGIGYQNDYQLCELSSRAIFIAIPTRLVNISGEGIQSGFKLFNTQKYSLILSRNMAPWLNLGLKASHLIRHLSGYNNHQLTLFDAGFQLFPSESVHMGFYVTNPAQLKWDLPEGEEYYPTLMASSVAYKPSKKLLVELGVQKEMEFATQLSYLMEVHLHKQVVVRGAASSQPIRLAFGTGISWQNLTFDMGLNHHASLGFSSAFGITFAIGSSPSPKNNPSR